MGRGLRPPYGYWVRSPSLFAMVSAPETALHTDGTATAGEGEAEAVGVGGKDALEQDGRQESAGGGQLFTDCAAWRRRLS